MAARAGMRSGGVGPPKPARGSQGCDSGEWVTQLERTPALGDRPRPASRECQHGREVKLGREFAADEGGAGAEGVELGTGEIAVEGNHAAVGAGVNLRGLDVTHRLADDRGHFLRGLHPVACHVDGAYQHILVAQETEERHVHFFFSDPATTEIYTLSLHDALPI